MVIVEGDNARVGDKSGDFIETEWRPVGVAGRQTSMNGAVAVEPPGLGRVCQRRDPYGSQSAPVIATGETGRALRVAQIR